MNNISEQLLQTIDILADEKIKQLKFDRTIQATIYSVVDLDNGEYKVRYNGNIFSAYSEDNNKIYKVNDIVFLKVPEGNFSNKKIITSLVDNKSLSENEITNLTNSVFDVSPNFVTTQESNYGVIAGVPANEQGSFNIVYLNENNDFQASFQQYSNNYEYIRVKASFLTQLYQPHIKGNYGIKIVFNTKEQDQFVTYNLDLKNFNGQVYNFSTYSPQEIIVKVQKGYLTGLKSIQLFEENFDYDKDSENNIIIKENIFVRDISLQFVEIQDLSNINYYLTIATLQGTVFTEKENSLSLEGRLLCKGENIINNSKSKCQWYKQNLNIMVGDEKYDKEAGFGWERLDGKNTYILKVSNEEVSYSQRYKLIVNYNEEITLTAEMEILNVINFTKDYECEIIQTTIGDRIKLQLNSNFEAKGFWYISYPDNSYDAVNNKEKTDEIEISSYLRYSTIIFYCQVYDKNNNFIKILEYVINNSENESDLVIKYIGEDSFRYDANGDITMEDAEKGRTLQANVIWNPGFGTSYKLIWLINNEIIKDNSQVMSPNNSMLENLWIDSNNILHYNIKQKYKINYINNIITIKIETITGKTYTFEKELLFLKDGDQGTNGTTYVAAIRPCDDNGLKISGLQTLKYNNGGWTNNNIKLRCYVYKDGELINDKDNIKYKWEGVNVTINDRESLDDQTQQITVRGKEFPIEDSEKFFYVKIQITIDDNINIYTYYPINVIVGDALKDDINIEEIPSYIKYNSSGFYPSFYSNDLNFYYKEKTYNDNIESLNTKLLNIIDKDNKKYLSPVSSFKFEDKQFGNLRFNIPESNAYLIHTIIMYLDTYGNEAINGWNGTALDTGEGNYVFAPQIGAGKKENDNTFTGIVMGKDSGQEEIGLYGYQKGNNSFGLLANGTAFFGVGKLIQINGEDAIIKGGSPDSKNNMELKLINTSSSGQGETKAIQIGNNQFYVNYNGKLVANDAEISGNIKASGGTIGGWTIDSNSISARGLTLSSIEDKGNILSTKYFHIDKDGKLVANDAEISGNIKASGGTIGGWTIGSNSISAESTTLSSEGIISTDTFKINGYGYVGQVEGDDGENKTQGFGIKANNEETLILQTGGNARFSGGEIWIGFSNTVKIHFVAESVDFTDCKNIEGLPTIK